MSARSGGRGVPLGYRRGRRGLDEAQRVEFEVTQGPKGPQADQVRAI